MHHPHQHFHPTRPPALGRRYAVLGVGLLIMAFGIAFSIQGALGTSPISSLPYVVSLLIPLTVGEATICLHVVLILLQILILRRNYDPIQLMQLPGGGGVWLPYRPWGVGGPGTAGAQLWGAVDLLPSSGWCWWPLGWLWRSSLGWSPWQGEGFILAVCQVTAIPFGNMKVGFDLTLVAISVVLSLGFLHGLYGVREGTVAAAVLVGLTAKKLQPLLQRRLEKVLS